MRIGILAAALVATLAAPVTASADDATPFLAAGGALSAAGVVVLATTPLCGLSAIRADARPSCVVTSLVSGGVIAAVGVPLLVVGVRRRMAAVPVDVRPVAGGAVVEWRMSW